MTDLFPVTLDDMIECVQREIAMRHKVYPRWIVTGRMTADKAARELDLMVCVQDKLESLR